MATSSRDRLAESFLTTSRILRGESAVSGAAREALGILLAASADALARSAYDVSVLDSRMPRWRSAVEDVVIPTLYDVHEGSWTAEIARAAAEGVPLTDANPYAARHMESVWNRLVGVADQVFDVMRVELDTGRQAGEDMRKLSARVDALLSDGQRWKNRAMMIARTEVVAANNAGQAAAARAISTHLGAETSEVVKEWLATTDTRTRESHAEADGQTVVGLDTPFIVGGPAHSEPGDPSAPPEEVVQCRCTVLYHYPGDPDYQEARMNALTAAAGPEEDPDPTDDQPVNTSTVIVALPAADDPVQNIGPEQKHSTLLWLGVLDDAAADAIRAAVTDLTGTSWPMPFEQDTAGVGLLGDDDPQAVVVHMSTDARDLEYTLEAFRDRLMENEDVRRAYEAQKQWPRFTPHVTLGYGDEVTPEDRTAGEGLSSIRFDRLAVWQGDRQDEYPLGPGTPAPETEPAPADDTQEDPVPPTPPTSRTAAAGDPVPTIQDRSEALDAGDAVPVLMPADEAVSDSDRFHGVVVVENEQTGDGRAFQSGSLEWVDLPMPFGWQIADASGHDGSVVCGRIDSFVREGNAIWYEGTWDLDGAGWETRRMVEGQFLRGPSVDVDDVAAVVVTPDGEPLEGMDFLFMEPGDEPLLVVTQGRIRSAVLCRVPAFSTTWIMNGPLPADRSNPAYPGSLPAPEEEPPAEAVEAALVAAAQPYLTDAPPADWFSYPGEDLLLSTGPDGRSYPVPLTVTDDGRVFGYLATWGTCHIGFKGTCVTAPESPTDYALFNKGQVVCSDGSRANVGSLTMGTGHADPRLGMVPALAHYDNTGAKVADVHMGADGVGVWFSGALRDGVTDRQRADLMAAGSVSGDWRERTPRMGDLDLVAALVVNVPGFPIPRVAAGLDHGRQRSLVAAGVVEKEPSLVAAPPGVDSEVFAAQVARAMLALQDRRARVAAAAGTLRSARVARAARAFDRLETR